jgi:hypothetical protein
MSAETCYRTFRALTSNARLKKVGFISIIDQDWIQDSEISENFVFAGSLIDIIINTINNIDSININNIDSVIM